MIESAERLFTEILPPPPPGRSPALACVLGFLFGGIGLAIYLRSVVDLILPIAILIVGWSVLGNFGPLVGAFVAAAYGYFRVHLAPAPRAV